MPGRWTVCLLTAALVAGSALEAPAARTRRKPRRATRRARVQRPPAPPSLVVPVSASGYDMAVGEACRRGLEGVHGAAVAMDPHTGRVLAVVNPGLAVSTAYQPCSVFKIVVAIAGLTEGVITPDTIYH